MIYLTAHVPDNAPEATRYLKEFIGEHYYYDDKPVFKAMWDNYVDCQFVEDDGACDSLMLVESAF